MVMTYPNGRMQPDRLPNEPPMVDTSLQIAPSASVVGPPPDENTDFLSQQLKEDLASFEEEDDYIGPDVEYSREEWEKYINKKCPEPTINDIMELKQDLQSLWAKKHSQIRDYRKQRYMHEHTPEKWRKDLRDGRRFYSRMSHNEIMRVVAMMGRNATVFKQNPAGKYDKDRNRAMKQERWANEFWAAMERKAGEPVVRLVDDAQAGDGIGAYEIYYDPYDEEYMKKRDTEEAKDYMKRTDRYMKGHCALGVRPIDPLALLFDRDDNGIYVALIWERKPLRHVKEKYGERLGTDKMRDLERPRPGDRGAPYWNSTIGDRSASSTNYDTAEDFDELDSYPNTVETIRYYDEKWYAYVIDGEMVECEPHGLRCGVPVVIQEGMTTSSPNISERYQGVTWGMMDMEKAMNDLLTKELDNSFTFGQPKPVIQTPKDAMLMVGSNDKPTVLDLSQPGVPQLNPGQVIVDAFSNFKPYPVEHIQNLILALWQRSGLNPIASGESPGADPAGYTVNTLQGSAQNLYEVLLDNKARAQGQVVDKCRMIIRDTVREKVYLPMGANHGDGNTEWMALSDEDIDEVPVEAWIDPLSDANRLSKRQSLQQGHKEGFVPLDVVITDGFGADDPQIWKDMMIIDSAEKAMAGMALEVAQSIVRQRIEAEAMQQAGQAPTQEPGPNGVGVGAAPAAPNAPAMTPGMAEASSGPPALSPSRAQAGQNRGYNPPSNA